VLGRNQMSFYCQGSESHIEKSKSFYSFALIYVVLSQCPATGVSEGVGGKGIF